MADCTHGLGQLPIPGCRLCEVERLRALAAALTEAGNAMSADPWNQIWVRQWAAAVRAAEAVPTEPEEAGT